MTGFLLLNTPNTYFFPPAARFNLALYPVISPFPSRICGAKKYNLRFVSTKHIFSPIIYRYPRNMFFKYNYFKSNAFWTFKILFCEAYWVQISLANYTDSVFKQQRSVHNDKCVEVANQTFQIPYFALKFARFLTAKCEFSYVLRGLEVLKQLQRPFRDGFDRSWGPKLSENIPQN